MPSDATPRDSGALDRLKLRSTLPVAEACRPNCCRSLTQTSRGALNLHRVAARIHVRVVVQLLNGDRSAHVPYL